MGNRGYAGRVRLWEERDLAHIDKAIDTWLSTRTVDELDVHLTRLLDLISKQSTGLASLSVESTRPKENTMSLEQAVIDLTVALNANTAALQGAKAAAAPAAASAPAAGKGAAAKGKDAPAPAPAAPKNKYEREEMAGLLAQVKEKFEAPAAKAIIKDVGGVEKLVAIPEDKIDAVYEAAKAKLEESAEGDGL